MRHAEIKAPAQSADRCLGIRLLDIPGSLADDRDFALPRTERTMLHGFLFTLAGSSLFREPCYAQAFENGRELQRMRRVVAHSGPVYQRARNGEGRIERKASSDRGTRRVKPAQPSEGGRQVEMGLGIIAIGFDRPPTP
jgi:hypothetical protein